MSHELTAYLSIFNLFKLNELWPYYQKHVNQIILNRLTLLKVSFTNILDLFLNFVDCEFFLESNSPYILAACETNLDYSIHFGNSSVRRTSFCTGLISRKPCIFLLIFSTGFTSINVLLLFPLSITFFIFVHGF